MVLQDAKFSTRNEEVQQRKILCFEDDAIIGFACSFATGAELLTHWKEAELSALRHFGPSLKNAQDKAWNVYTVLFCALVANTEERRQIQWLEEDMELTRKIIGCRISTQDELIQTILPILPLQQQPLLQSEDVTSRLRIRIESIAPNAADLVMNDAVPPNDVIRFLAGPS